MMRIINRLIGISTIRWTVTGLLVLITVVPSVGQQQAMYTQYMFNGLVINPAYAGSHGAASFTGLARQQWTGLPGGPSSQTFSVHAPIQFRRASWGVLLSRDDQDVLKQYGVYASYAYRIPIARGQLSLGLQGGVVQAQADMSKVNVVTASNTLDPAFVGDISTNWLPNVGAGLYYHTKRYYVGLSVPQLINQPYSGLQELKREVTQKRHYFLTGGYVFVLNSTLKLKPNILVKSVVGAPVEVDLNANLLIQEKLWFGLGYRSFDALNALVQLRVTPQLSVGYAYDYTVSGLSNVQSGSHELMVNYVIRISKESVLSPRYF